MKRKYWFLVLCGLLGACDYGRGEFEQNLNSLLEQPKSVAFTRLGMPTDEGTIDGKKFYVWSTSGVGFMPNMDVTNGYGSVGSTPYQFSQTTFGGGQAIPTHCIIRLFIDKKNIVTSWNMDGSAAGCKGYMNMLRRPYAQ